MTVCCFECLKIIVCYILSDLYCVYFLREGEGERERQRERETERETERDRERDTEREFRKYLTKVLICVFLFKFIRDVESRNELFLAFGFSFLFGYYIGHDIVYSLLYKTTKNINTEIELVIKDYNASTTITTSIYKFLHFLQFLYIMSAVDPLQNSRNYYEIIFNSNFKGYENHIRNQAMSSAIKAELDDIHFECDLLKSHKNQILKRI